MDIIEPVVLGIVQGIAEFLPISSTAHLKIIPALLHWPDPGAAASAVIQLGTVAAVLIYFAKDITHTVQGMVKAFLPGGDRNSPEARLGLAVLLGTLPVCVLGLLLKKYIENEFRSNIVIAITQIVMALVLFVAERATRPTRPLDQVSVRDGWIVGAAQCLALVPGASRSGSTLIGAFLTGLQRDAAVRFSFLLSIPATFLAGMLEMKDFISPKAPEPGAVPTMLWSTPELILATVVSGIVGYLAIAWLLKYLARHSAIVFVVYRVLLGVLLLYLIRMNFISVY